MGRNYRNIKAWQLANRLVLQIYKLTKDFPQHELYGLTSQMRRAAVSIATNIAEGSNRGHKKEYLHFLNIAKGSSAEVEYLISLARELAYIEDKIFDELNEISAECSKTLLGLIRSVEKEA